MSRIVNVNNPAKLRDHARRTVAELLRRLMLKRVLDDESRDMAATVVLALEDIAHTVETTTLAWEKRDYFLKADRFRLEWEWAGPAAQRLNAIILADQWDRLPSELASLAPRFADVRITRMTRSSADWQGNYHLLTERT